MNKFKNGAISIVCNDLYEVGVHNTAPDINFKSG